MHNFLRVSLLSQPIPSPCVATVILLLLCGCAGRTPGSNFSPAPVPSSPTSTPQSQMAAPGLGYVWDRTIHGLRQVEGVAGSAYFSAPALTDTSVTTTVTSSELGYALLLDAKGNLSLALLPTGTPRPLGSQNGWTSLAISSTGNEALVFGASSDAPQIITGLPQKPVLQPLGFSSSQLPIVGAAVGDTGAVLTASQNGDGTVSIQAYSAQGAETSPLKLAAFGGAAFVPGTDTAIVADGNANSVYQIASINTAAAATPLNTGSGISHPIGLEVTSDRHWVLLANAQGNVLQLDLTGAQPPASAQCNCTPTTVQSMDGAAVQLTQIGAGPVWIMQAAAKGPRILFVPAPTSSGAGGQP